MITGPSGILMRLPCPRHNIIIIFIGCFLLGVRRTKEDAQDRSQHPAVQEAYTIDRRGDERVFQQMGRQWRKE